MRLAASDFNTYHRPSRCELRVYLRHRGELEEEPGEYEAVLRRLGQRHERQHLASLGPVVMLDTGSREERERLTRQAVTDEQEVVYQPALSSALEIDGQRWEVVGDPDLLIKWGKGYIIRDCKISQRITHRDHPEIHYQLELYGWLYERTFGEPPVALEVYNGAGEITQLAFKGGTRALQELEAIARVKQAKHPPYTPVGWTKCQQCAFRYRCWPEAVERKDVSLVYGLHQWMALELRKEGIETYTELVQQYSAERLARLTKPSAAHGGKVGKRASSILRMARALSTGEEILIAPPEIPEHPNYVMFDLEGMPPQLQEPAKIYLWGLQVYGERPGEFRCALADFGPEGDRNAWFEFLEQARDIFEQHGDLPFVHWYSYEKTNIEMYLDRYGDPEGTAARVLDNLLDLLPVTLESVALPLSSYSLKVVERHIGYERSLRETGGDWAMARYVEAVETEDETERQALMKMIIAYNREDLEAMWGVMQWLKDRAAPAVPLRLVE
ncbi:MAG: TM0106 family RecB-like putative nuclease [Gemmatimonadota bacterium]|nr:MAG: TM0106 family RecB-like putative nuclease [Gemmatimonadota bacterium]